MALLGSAPIPKALLALSLPTMGPVTQILSVGILFAQPVADVLSAMVTVLMALHLHKELGAVTNCRKKEIKNHG